MISVIATFLALALSLIGLIFLCIHSPKRRRVYDLPKRPKTSLTWLMAILVFIPIPLLVYFGQNSALVMWLAAMPLVGWLVALKRPAVKE